MIRCLLLLLLITACTTTGNFCDIYRKPSLDEETIRYLADQGSLLEITHNAIMHRDMCVE